MKPARLAVAAFVAALGAANGPAVAAVFSPETVFTLPDRNYIDDRCKDARAFADKAATDYLAIDAATASHAERAFVDCAVLPRLNPDIDQQRYLVLAAATCAFIVGTKASGSAAETAFHAADQLATQLGAATPQQTFQVVTTIQGSGSTPNAGGPSSPTTTRGSSTGPPRVNQEIVRDPLGRGHALKFSDIATNLRQAVADALAAAPSSPPPGKP
jgi:hypothetical protein